MRKILLLVFSLLLLNGCTPKPIPDSSWISVPKEKESAGVYFYQPNIGIAGSAYDVGLYIDGEKLGEINTREYLYFELPAGKHTYGSGNIFTKDYPIEFVAGNNYIFKGMILNCLPYVYVIRDEFRIKNVIESIKSGLFEIGTLD